MRALGLCHLVRDTGHDEAEQAGRAEKREFGCSGEARREESGLDDFL